MENGVAAPGYCAYCIVNGCKCAGNAVDWCAVKFVAYCDGIVTCCCCNCKACNWCAAAVAAGWWLAAKDGWNTGIPVLESAKAVRLFDSCCAL